MTIEMSGLMNMLYNIAELDVVKKSDTIPYVLSTWILKSPQMTKESLVQRRNLMRQGF